MENPNREQAFLRAGRQGQWRDVLTAGQVERIITGNRAMMEKFNHLPARADPAVGTAL